ncbi:heteromeric transposase endonuclease subunit TnsA [Clostridium magnum]|uniref:Transposon Tn7 transposition protein TnsA n=1 Tax=Clostridium magnum DSM 2767 TaxID=1121326 RepID=A0A161XFE5_9CLOT|nr:heteromeric transposase endonuclease subunit TnsA [Clostridium magnum]KZL93246.1 transposon Tn7 transposition protein TnsA [Clostridium magnum DSM 2767]SHI19268.1 TnsA endonuclease C terminal [Clostridium magnum DSM 2767]
MKQRKSDKYRIIEDRGVGRGIHYKPFIKVHEVSSEGLSSRVLGWKVNRIYHLLSNLERDYLFNTQWEDSVIDIREQYPLLPKEETILIAKEYGLRHPLINKPDKDEIVMTSDFVITINDGKMIRDIVRTIKPSSKITKRVKEKFKIEEMFWKRKNIDWGVVTEKEIDHIKARNIRFLYQYYFWDRYRMLERKQIRELFLLFWDIFQRNNFDVKRTVETFDCVQGWEQGESLSFFKYLICHKSVKTDITKDITNLRNPNISFWM